MLPLPGMQLSLPKEVLAIVSKMQTAGEQIYVVGGSVRDLLLNRPCQDWDFTTSAHPETLLSLFSDSFYENNFGTVSVVRKHLYEQLGFTSDNLSDKVLNEVYEITTFRSENSYSDHRRPDNVNWGETIYEDLQRRDFTVNAMALELDISNMVSEINGSFTKLPETITVQAKLIDPYDGQGDLKNKVIKTVGDPRQRFEEDALRMLRAVRMAAQLQFTIDPETLIATQLKSGNIAHVSWERIRDELLKIIVTPHVEDAFEIMRTTGLLAHILPELLETKGVDQRGHHEHDVWTHSLRACALTPSSDPIVKLAALLHDIAKPQTQQELPEQLGEYSFHNHEVIGARIARDIARRLRLSKKDTQRMFTLVRWHMFYYQPEMTDAAIRRFIRRVGEENIDDIMSLREGDRLGSGSKRTSWRLEEMKERVDQQLNQPMQINDLEIDGHDVMEHLGLQPGPKIGELLQVLFEEVLEDPKKNKREYLLNRLSQLYKQG